MAKNVVTPAIISVDTFVLFSFKPKNFFHKEVPLLNFFLMENYNNKNISKIGQIHRTISNYIDVSFAFQRFLTKKVENNT